MKKSYLVITIIGILAVAVLAFVIYLVNYQGLTLYFLLVSGDNASGYNEAESFKNFSTEKLLEIIADNKDFNKYPPKHLKGYLKSGRYAGAIDVLGGRTHPIAINELTKIINTHSIGGRNDAIYSIGRHKNKAMLPVLCEALKKHTDNHTDDLIVDALDSINDPTALDCLIQEKDKLKWKDTRLKAEEAIARWKQK